jgi:hypothetical protein
MFVRLFKNSDTDVKGKEIIINVDTVWKIEVEYAVPDGKNANAYWRTTVETGHQTAEAVRSYKIFASSEVILLMADPNDKVVRIFEDIYKNAIKADPPAENDVDG